VLLPDAVPPPRQDYLAHSKAPRITLPLEVEGTRLRVTEDELWRVCINSTGVTPVVVSGRFLASRL